ncbi:MAG: ATP:cob(I)alamin adenosyltransferase, partial [Gammaproteobacteria bacterium]|nr:ATP:cob(I)alamin adenosyltransferase [Gammaproteobacteria bacterium]
VERSLVSLNREQSINKESMAFINRLSDLLFVIARQCCKDDGVDEIYWQKAKTQP